MCVRVCASVRPCLRTLSVDAWMRRCLGGLLAGWVGASCVHGHGRGRVCLFENKLNNAHLGNVAGRPCAESQKGVCALQTLRHKKSC